VGSKYCHIELSAICGREGETYYPSRNITIATFSEFGFFKKEGYESNLWAGKILAEHGVPLAYKSVGTAEWLQA